MKKASEMLNHLKINPTFKKIHTQSTLDKVVSFLPPNLKDGIDFYYIKNKTLFFVLIHQGYKFEFKNENNINLIKSLLNQASLSSQIDDVKYFVTNKPKIKKAENLNKITFPKYERKSWAIFDNKAKDLNIYQKFEQIRALIKNKI